jgi:hypothetical protein
MTIFRGGAMTITFADGTRIEVASSALDDFLTHDLKWVEFVHGRAKNQPLLQPIRLANSNSPKQNDCRCPAC